MATQLIGAAVEVRTEAIELFKNKVRELSKDDTNDGNDVLCGAAAAAIDYAVGGVLDAVENHYEDIITGSTDHDEDPGVNLTCVSGLSETYFESVNT
ncbi:hypothetical protein [Pseudomonas phage PA1C]|uniref:Uncharacterized protein n=1 Tax=Pseudomonas phage vB_PaeM_PS119XW TaxID=2601632 RepID=A0A5C1K826_9CAUD|nr:hypothetical protein PP933_gp311 [Pseudomonas phage vB_PaeM_PS119XW]QBX32468.1 hypothetical protein [Pseudomonas phage PA1C]QEM42040.1 hypothetical protein [Pseudomonas phage vB_PaeM_PS119XW]BEG72555.1 hypothetical protein RVBP21_1830 [Pseudomonas phage BRkr]